jgi:hypothetical protein
MLAPCFSQCWQENKHDWSKEHGHAKFWQPVQTVPKILVLAKELAGLILVNDYLTPMELKSGILIMVPREHLPIHHFRIPRLHKAAPTCT